MGGSVHRRGKVWQIKFIHRGEGAKPATIRYELGVLGRAYNLAMKAGMLVTRPLLPQVKVNNAQGLRDGGGARPPHGAPAHRPCSRDRFAYTTGWRIGEIRNLKWASVNFTEGVVRIEGDATKNEEARTFPVVHVPAVAGPRVQAGGHPGVVCHTTFAAAPCATLSARASRAAWP